MIQNDISLFVRVWGEQYSEELIRNITLYVVMVLAGHYNEEMLLKLLY